MLDPARQEADLLASGVDEFAQSRTVSRWYYRIVASVSDNDACWGHCGYVLGGWKVKVEKVMDGKHSEHRHVGNDCRNAEIRSEKSEGARTMFVSEICCRAGADRDAHDDDL